MLGAEPRSFEGQERTSDTRARQIVEGVPGGFLDLDPAGRVADCNPVAERLFGRSREDLIGCGYCDLLGLGRDTAFEALIERVAQRRAPEEAELRVRIGRRQRLLEVCAFPLDDGVGVFWRDITARRAAARRLAESEARFREIADGAPGAAWLSQADGKMLFINQAMVDALGRPREELLGEGWVESVDPEDRPALLAVRLRARTDHASVRYEGRFRRPDGSLRIIEVHGRPRFDAEGAFCGHVGVAVDVTEARAHQQAQRLLVNELNHRVKNTLATVQSLVRHTLRDYDVPRAAEQAVTARILALSSAHNVLNRENWEGADLSEIAAEVLRPYDRIAVSGPRLRVEPRTAIALAMALQELATNAVKYGALSSPAGGVRLGWRRSGPAIELKWREHDGPPVAQPELSGFGSALLGRMLAGEIGQAAELDYRPDGLVCRIRAPAAPAG